jgi:hypothetical protein
MSRPALQIRLGTFDTDLLLEARPGEDGPLIAITQVAGGSRFGFQITAVDALVLAEELGRYALEVTSPRRPAGCGPYCACEHCIKPNAMAALYRERVAYRKKVEARHQSRPRARVPARVGAGGGMR